MKLHEIIDKIDVKKLEEKSLEWDFFEEFDIFDLKSHVYKEFESRLKEHFIEYWYCSDQIVGVRLIFFDDEFLCIGSKRGRKSEEEFEYVSQNKFIEFYNYIKSFEFSDEPRCDTIDFNVDVAEGYKIHFSSEIMDHKNVFYKGKLCEIINKRPIDDHLCQVIEIIHNSENIVVKLKDVLFPYDLKPL